MVHVAGRRADRDAAIHLLTEAFLSAYGRWGHDDVRRLAASDRVHEETARQHFIIGEPSECVEQITMCREIGIGHIACLMNFGRPPLDFVDASLRRFGKDVLPHFL